MNRSGWNNTKLHNINKCFKSSENDPKKTPRKIQTGTKSEEKISDNFFLLTGRHQLFSQNHLIKKEIINSKLLEPVIDDKLKEVKRRISNSKKKLSKEKSKNKKSNAKLSDSEN